MQLFVRSKPHIVQIHATWKRAHTFPCMEHGLWLEERRILLQCIWLANQTMGILGFLSDRILPTTHEKRREYEFPFKIDNAISINFIFVFVCNVQCCYLVFKVRRFHGRHFGHWENNHSPVWCHRSPWTLNCHGCAHFPVVTPYNVYVFPYLGILWHIPKFVQVDLTFLMGTSAAIVQLSSHLTWLKGEPAGHP